MTMRRIRRRHISSGKTRGNSNTTTESTQPLPQQITVIAAVAVAVVTVVAVVTAVAVVAVVADC